MTIRAGIHQARSAVAWADECLATLDDLQEGTGSP
jgi:hypothetical protein